MNLLFTVCGRAGSKGFKNKNLKEMNGIPLVYYTLAAIRGFSERHADDKIDVILNTDSGELKEIVMRQTILSDIIYLDRKPDLAGDIVAKADVIKDSYIQAKKNISYDVVIDTDITSPLRRIDDIENVLEVYSSNDQYDLVFSVVDSRRSPYFNMVERKENGIYQKVCRSNYTARQQAPECYELNASIYAYRPSFLESEITKTILEYQCGISVMPDYLVLDIDSERDFEMMSMLHKYFYKNDKGIRLITDIAKQCLTRV